MAKDLFKIVVKENVKRILSQEYLNINKVID